jgi:agmatinase
MARAKETVKNIVAVGIRSMDSSEVNKINKNKIFFDHLIHNTSDWTNQVIKQLSQNVYISLDIDIFETGIMPSTGTPEPGGLSWYEVINLLENVSARKNIVGFDLVELCPIKNNKAPDFLAAKLIYLLLSYIFKK